MITVDRSIFKVQVIQKNFLFRLLLFPFPTVQNAYPIKDNTGFLYRTLKIVFNRVIVLNSVLLYVDTDHPEYDTIIDKLGKGNGVPVMSLQEGNS